MNSTKVFDPVAAGATLVNADVGAPASKFDPAKYGAYLSEEQPNEVQTFLGRMPKSRGLKNDLETLGISLPITPKEQQSYREAQNQRLLGGGEALANFPIKVANLFRDQPIDEFSFSPKTSQAEQGKVAGELASYFIPGGALKGVANTLSSIPKVRTILNALSSRRGLNALLNIPKVGAETALVNAAYNPQDATGSALEGFGLGAGMQAAVNALTLQNPILRTLARLGLGAGIGYGVHHPYYGALAAAALPDVGRIAGYRSRNALAEEQLGGLTSRDISRAKSASDRLGTTLTPAQASGNYVTAALEGNLKRSPQGSQFAYRQERKQLREQRNAINSMLDNIYQPTPKNEAKINELYKNAEAKNINPLIIGRMKLNPIMENAFNSVKNNPAFTQLPENNYKFLAEVDRTLARQYKGSLDKPNTAHEIKQVKKSFNSFLKQVNPDYKKATRAAQPKIVRENIETKLNKLDEDVTGKNFYNKFLNTKKSYENLLRDTTNFPKAQRAIKDMRQAWKHLSNIKTVSQGEAQSKTAIDQARDWMKAVIESMKKYAGAKGDIEGLKYIYSKDWDKDFDRMIRIRDQAKRNRELLSLLSRLGLAYGLTDGNKE